MKKSGLDERQERIMEEIGAKSFTVMFLVCAAVIVGELAWSGNLGSVAGETAVLAAGGIIYMAGCMKNGIWTKSGRKMTLGQNILLSVIFSGIFSAAYAFMIARKTADGVNVARIAGLFFIVVAAFCFLCLWCLGKLAWNKHEKEENRCQE